MTPQSRRYGSHEDHRRSLLRHAPYPLNARRSEPLWHSIVAGIVLPFSLLCMILLCWGVS